MPQQFGELRYLPGGFPYHYNSKQIRGNVWPELQAAIAKFLAWTVEKKEPLTKDEQDLLFDYVVYVINAPCWQAILRGKIEEFRKEAEEIDTPEKLDIYLEQLGMYNIEIL
ncbi:MAG TPA: hypothetical protein VFV08_17040 [Puia sp.]|nr:hypothetical protein [Puia sp.]